MDHNGDIEFALEIHQRLNNNIGVTENAIYPKNLREKEYVPRTLVDQTLELIDPTPNIYTLFVQFNTKYFWNKLLSIEVKWSNRMTSCAGVCSFHPRNRQCIITLSAPLLKLRPRKDLVETLLHEMIHGYLFLTNNDRDRDGHGPEFHKHMYRINKDAGTNITVYHSFHDEVRLYQQHWWRCNGPCQNKAPFFGTVRRAMNRAPGPNDNWWSMHQQTCGGQFIKVREPEKKPAKNKKISEKKLPHIPKTKDISDWLTKPDKSKNFTPSPSNVPVKTLVNNSVTSRTTNNIIPSTSKASTFTKLGNNSNNIHGWGVGGPNGSPRVPLSSNIGTKNPKFNVAGVLGGSGSQKSNLLDKFPPKNVSTAAKSTKVPGYSKSNNISSSNVMIDLSGTPNKRKINDFTDVTKKLPKIQAEKLPENAKCPVCDKFVNISKLNDHLDKCLVSASTNDTNHSTPKLSRNQNASTQNSKINLVSSPIVIHDSSDSESSQSLSIVEDRQKCLVCNELIEPGVTLNEHLDACFGSAFTDDSIPEFEDNDDENTSGNQLLEKSFPCPICMTLVSETLMNQHLDTCLSKDLLKNLIE